MTPQTVSRTTRVVPWELGLLNLQGYQKKALTLDLRGQGRLSLTLDAEVLLLNNFGQQQIYCLRLCVHNLLPSQDTSPSECFWQKTPTVHCQRHATLMLPEAEALKADAYQCPHPGMTMFQTEIQCFRFCCL